MSETRIVVRSYRPDDEGWAEAMMEGEFGGRMQARRGELIDALAQPGFVAEDETGPVGLLTYRREGAECELVLLWARVRTSGIGTALVRALREAVADCARIWVVTTNDNIDALRFYQRRGFALSALRVGAVDDSRRRFKPAISPIGDYGIPLRDEVELAWENPEVTGVLPRPTAS